MLGNHLSSASGRSIRDPTHEFHDWQRRHSHQTVLASGPQISHRRGWVLQKRHTGTFSLWEKGTEYLIYSTNIELASSSDILIFFVVILSLYLTRCLFSRSRARLVTSSCSLVPSSIAPWQTRRRNSGRGYCSTWSLSISGKGPGWYLILLSNKPSE